MIHDKKKYTSNIGFTLIELLVGLTIVSIIFGVSYSSYRQYSRRRILNEAQANLISKLRLAQTLALTGTKPQDPWCQNDNYLLGVNFTVSNTTQAYIITFRCSGGNVAYSGQDNITEFKADPMITITRTGPFTFDFKPLGQGTTLVAGEEVVITLRDLVTNDTRVVKVEPNGEIK